MIDWGKTNYDSKLFLVSFNPITALIVNIKNLENVVML